MTYRLSPETDPEVGALVEPLAIAHHALHRIWLKPIDSLVVIGAGSVGLAVLLCAKALGVCVVDVVDRGSAKGDLSSTCGASRYIDATEGYVTGGTAAAAIVASGHDGAINDAVAAVRPGGTVVVVAFSDAWQHIDANAVVQREVTIVGSNLATADDFHAVIDWIESGRVNPRPVITDRLPLLAAADGLRRLHQGGGEVGKVMLAGALR